MSVRQVRVRIRLAVLRDLQPDVPVQQAIPIVRCVAAAKVLIVLHANRVKTATVLHVRRAVIRPIVRHVHRAVIRHARHAQPTAVLTAALIAVARPSQNVQVT